MTSSRDRKKEFKEPYDKVKLIENLNLYLKETQEEKVKQKLLDRITLEQLEEKYSSVENVRLIEGNIKDYLSGTDAHLQYILRNCLKEALDEPIEWTLFPYKSLEKIPDDDFTPLYSIRFFPRYDKSVSLKKEFQYHEEKLLGKDSHLQKIATEFLHNYTYAGKYLDFCARAAASLADYYLNNIKDIRTAKQYAKRAVDLDKKYQPLLDKCSYCKSYCAIL